MKNVGSHPFRSSTFSRSCERAWGILVDILRLSEKCSAQDDALLIRSDPWSQIPPQRLKIMVSSMGLSRQMLERRISGVLVVWTAMSGSCL
jgi:hypothetical protein